MAKIFISYRRHDSAYIAAIINDKIQQTFGRDSVFFDIDNIPLGVDFRKYIGDAVGQCHVLLVIIGDYWVRESDDGGQRRLDDPSDYVRLEIESALKRNIPIIPILVGEATMPSPNDLPASIQDIAFRNAAEIRAGSDLRQHIDKLIRGLKTLCEPNALIETAESVQVQATDSHAGGEVELDDDTSYALKEIKILLTGYHDPRLYMAPGIPTDKLKAAITSYAGQLDPKRVLLLFDDSATGLAKVGFCLSAEGIYWRNVLTGPMHLPFKQVKELLYGRGWINRWLVLNDNKLYLNRCRDTDVFGDRVMKIIRFFRDRTI